MLARKVWVDAVERRLVVRPIVSRRLHPDQKNRKVAVSGSFQNAFKIGAADRRIDPAKKVVAAERDNHRIDLGRQRPLNARKAPGGGVA